jgi:hypothetical protein
MRENRKREHEQEQLKIYAALAAGVMLTGNAFLESRGGGPLTGVLLQPIHSIVSLATPSAPRTTPDPDRTAAKFE